MTNKLENIINIYCYFSEALYASTDISETFLDKLEADYGDLILRSNVRCLSAGKCSRRFFTHRKKVRIFFTEIAVD